MTYSVNEIFDTISGEAPTAGERCTFVRLQGCSVKCVGCDTNYSVYTETRDFKIGYIKGLAESDGTFSKQPQLSIGMKDVEALERFRHYWHDLFGGKWLEINWVDNGIKSKHPEGGVYRATGNGKERVLLFTEPPSESKEQLRGYVAGFFDGDGSSFTKATGRVGIEFSNTNDKPLDIIAGVLDRFLFSYGRGHHFHKYAKKNMYFLRLNRVWSCIGGVNEATQEGQRFFDTFQPAIKRKHGPWVAKEKEGVLGIDEIIPKCHEKLVIISGGDPVEQNLDKLITGLRSAGHTVQVETSGAFDFKGVERPDILVCSPKPNVKYHIATTVRESATAFKLVNGPEGSGFDWNEQLAIELLAENKRVFVMPYGQPPSKQSIQAAEEKAKALNCEFSPRLHYILGIR